MAGETGGGKAAKRPGRSDEPALIDIEFDIDIDGLRRKPTTDAITGGASSAAWRSTSVQFGAAPELLVLVFVLVYIHLIFWIGRLNGPRDQ